LLLGICFILCVFQVLKTWLESALQLVKYKCEYGSFAEWPDGRRPPCTTMPWTIWPTLVVLWGVYWMFYTPLSSTRWEEIVSSWNSDDADFGLNRESTHQLTSHNILTCGQLPLAIRMRRLPFIIFFSTRTQRSSIITLLGRKSFLQTRSHMSSQSSKAPEYLVFIPCSKSQNL